MTSDALDDVESFWEAARPIRMPPEPTLADPLPSDHIVQPWARLSLNGQEFPIREVSYSGYARQSMGEPYPRYREISERVEHARRMAPPGHRMDSIHVQLEDHPILFQGREDGMYGDTYVFTASYFPPGRDADPIQVSHAVPYTAFAVHGQVEERIIQTIEQLFFDLFRAIGESATTEAVRSIAAAMSRYPAGVGR